MERNKETVKKSYSDFYTSKRVGISKSDSSHLSIRSDSGRNKASYVSQSKNIPINKKCNFYDNEARSFFKNCEKCFHARPHIVVNTPCNVSQIDSGRDFNGNVTYNAYPICNLTSLVNYHPNQHYEISLSKCKSIKPRNVYQDQKSFNPKIPTPSFSSNKFYSSMPNSSVRCKCSKTYSSKYACSDSHFKITDKASQETVPINEKYSKYNVKSTFSEQCFPTDEVKLPDLPVFMHSKLPKDPCAPSAADYSENQVQRRKHYKKWDHISITNDIVESPKKLNDAEKMMLFPALPSGNHCQQIKASSNCSNSMPPSEISVENPNLDGVFSSSGSVNLTSSVAVSSTVPQASYADVIRMSSTCSGGVQSYVTLEIEKTYSDEENQLPPASIQEKLGDENPQHNSSDWVILRLSQIDLNSSCSLNNDNVSNQNGQNFVAPRPIVVSLEKPSFYNSSMSTCKSVLSTLPCSPGKKDDIESFAADSFSNSDKSSVDNSSVTGSTNRSSVSSDLTTSLTETQLASIKTDSVYSSPSSVSSFDAFKEIKIKDVNMDSLGKKGPPVIILNSSPNDSFSEISFGIEHEEMLKLCSDVSGITENNISISVNEDSNEDPFSDNISIVDPHTNLSLQSSDNVSTFNEDEIEISPDESISINGKRLHWEDSDVQFDRSNNAELAEYFFEIWNELDHDNQTDPGKTSGVIYYHDL